MVFNKYRRIAENLKVCSLEEAEKNLLNLDPRNLEALEGFYNVYRKDWDLRVNGLNIVGTGGDGKNTFNFSTAAAFVCAAAGIPVVKFGNRSATSKSGSVDFLQTLNISLSKTPDEVLINLDRANIAFISAQEVYPIFRRFSTIRKKITVPTIFNYLGPLLNPVDTSLTVLGVSRPDMATIYTGFLEKIKRNGVVLTSNGFDEAIPFQLTEVYYCSRKQEILPNKTGRLEDLAIASPEQSAKIILDIFEGKDKSVRYDCVALNAGIAISYYNKIDFDDGIRIAKNTINSKKAHKTLKKCQLL